jgi:two-component system sensor histidine kinase SenX3
MLVVVLVAVLVIAVVGSAVASERAARWRLERANAEVSRVHARETDAYNLRERMIEALNAIPDGVVIVDEVGTERFRNTVARGFAESRHAEVLVEEAVQQVLRDALAGFTNNRDLDVLGPPKRSLVISAFPLHHGSVRTGALAILEDVSERKQLDAMRRDFVANVSHELRTPVGALGLLAETITTEDDPVVIRRLAERMTDEAHRVGRIIEDLLALSRIEGDLRPTPEVLRLNEVITEAADRVAGLSEAHRIRFEFDVDFDALVNGDRRQLVSAVSNLLENACNYSDDDSVVHISVRPEAGWVEVMVRDQGIGIPSSDLERVFERFYRVDRARRRETGGTGLGLAIVRHVAVNHGGDVRVESREGEGSTFTIRLPAVTA